MEKGFVLEVKTSASFVMFSGYLRDEPMFTSCDEDAVFYTDLDEAKDDYEELSNDGYDVEISSVSRAR